MSNDKYKITCLPDSVITVNDKNNITTKEYDLKNINTQSSNLFFFKNIIPGFYGFFTEIHKYSTQFMNSRKSNAGMFRRTLSDANIS